MATTSYVNTDNVGSTDGTTVATGWTSLSSAISNLPATFVDDYIIQCSGTAADTTAATFSGKTFSTFNVQVVGNAAEADGFNDTDFEYSTSHYRLDQTSSGTSIDLSTGPVTLDGIQVSQKSGNFARAILAAPGSGMAHTVKNCRVKGNTGTGNGCLYFIPRSSGSSIAQNNVIVGASSNDSGVHVKVTNFFNTLTIYISGNSIKDFSATTGGGIELEDASGHSSSTCIIENNAVIDCGDDYNTASAGAGFSTFSLDYNGGDDADLNGTTNGQDLSVGGTESTEWALHFTAPNAAAGSIDLTPVSGGNLDGNGTTGTGILSTDILGTTHNSPQDIGAFALAATATTINAPAASVAYTMLVPTVSTGVAIAAAAAALAYTFQVPTVAAGVRVEAPAATLGYTFQVPTVATGVGVEAPAASLGYTFQVPTVTASQNTVVAAPAASLGYTFQVPTVATGVGVEAPAAILGYTFQVPTVTATPAGDTTIAAPAAILGYTFQVPTVATGVGVEAPAASITYSFKVATVSAGAVAPTGPTTLLEQLVVDLDTFFAALDDTETYFDNFGGFAVDVEHATLGTLRGIMTTDQLPVGAGDVQIRQFLMTATAAEGVELGSTITAEEVDYHVRGRRPDGFGLVTLLLEVAPDVIVQ